MGTRGHPVIFSATLYDDLLSPARNGRAVVVWRKSEIDEGPHE